jgi:hypothetical protein
MATIDVVINYLELQARVARMENDPGRADKLDDYAKTVKVQKTEASSASDDDDVRQAAQDGRDAALKRWPTHTDRLSEGERGPLRVGYAAGWYDRKTGRPRYSEKHALAQHTEESDDYKASIAVGYELGWREAAR